MTDFVNVASPSVFGVPQGVFAALVAVAVLCGVVAVVFCQSPRLHVPILAVTAVVTLGGIGAVYAVPSQSERLRDALAATYPISDVAVVSSTQSSSSSVSKVPANSDDLMSESSGVVTFSAVGADGESVRLRATRVDDLVFEVTVQEKSTATWVSASSVFGGGE